MVASEALEHLVRGIVEHPDDVVVRERRNRNRGDSLTVRVNPDDMGRVIGKGGKVANSIRTLLRVAAEREGKQATLDVVEPE